MKNKTEKTLIELHREMAVKYGRRGGRATVKKYGKGHMSKIAQRPRKRKVA